MSYEKIPVYTVSFYPENPITCWKTMSLILMVYTGCKIHQTVRPVFWTSAQTVTDFGMQLGGKNKQPKIRTSYKLY